MVTAFRLTGQPFQIYDIPRVDNNEPPHKPPPPVRNGDYCFRAQAELVDASDNELMKFTGYDKDFGITDKVENVCKVHEKNNHGKCTNVKMFFIGAHPKCNGQIEVESNQKNV